MRTLRLAAPALLLALLVLVPNLGRAFTIDDTLFLRQAEHLLVDPLHPTAFEMAWTDEPARVSAIMPSGPVMAWLLVPALRLGGVEWAAHLATLALLLIGLLATAALARRIGLDDWSARVACLLVVSAPAVLGMAATVMPDLPAMALGVLGMERLLAWRDEARGHQAAAAAIALGLAPLARSHLALLLGLGALALVDGDLMRPSAWRAVPRRRWLPLAAALGLSAALLRLTRDPLPAGASVAGAVTGFATLGYAHRHLVAFATHWAVTMPLALPWLARRWRAVPRRRAIGLVIVIALLIVAADFARFAWLAPLPALGALALIDVIEDAGRRRDRTQLLLGLWLLVALPVCLYVQMAPKYLVAAAPAAALLVARALAPLRHRNLAALATVGLGLLLGVAILRADARFSSLARDAATRLIAPRVKAGQRVWFAGHWGWQWYATRAGARCLTLTPPHPVRGDIVVASRHSEGGLIDRMPDRMPDRRRIDSLGDSTPGGRLMSGDHCAGFYSDAWGFLPWMWGSSEIERFDVWEMQ